MPHIRDRLLISRQNSSGMKFSHYATGWGWATLAIVLWLMRTAITTAFVMVPSSPTRFSTKLIMNHLKKDTPPLVVEPYYLGLHPYGYTRQDKKSAKRLRLAHDIRLKTQQQQLPVVGNHNITKKRISVGQDETGMESRVDQHDMSNVGRTIEQQPPLHQSAPTMLNISMPSTNKTVPSNPNQTTITSHDNKTVTSKQAHWPNFEAPNINFTTPNLNFSVEAISSFFGATKKPTDPLTLQDLESILLNNKYVRQSDLPKVVTTIPTQTPALVAATSSIATTTTPSDRMIVSKTAFPQPSLMSELVVQRGCTVAGGLCGMVLGVSLVPNLWLVGAIFGGFYGKQITKKLAASQELSTVGSFVLALGRWIAEWYLKAYDAVNTLFFMYKTGQLSYEYYRTYETLDKRFAIQDKIDAWNARFVEGKIAFDNWEKDNEVSRRLLASLRTMWLVEQRSLSKSRRRRQSKYRIVQFVYDFEFFVRRMVSSVWKAVTGGGSGDLREFLKGLRIEMSESRAEEFGSRIGAVLVSLLAVNATGALFAISPALLSMMAILLGLSWPTWVSEFGERFAKFVDETRARGRGELQASRDAIDKNRYHYYRQLNGKKRYYRTGQPWFGSLHKEEKRKARPWPWQSAPTREPGFFEWGLFRQDRSR